MELCQFKYWHIEWLLFAIFRLSLVHTNKHFKFMTIQEYKELCKKDVLRIGQDISVIKLGTTVQSKIHDDIQGDVVLLDRGNDYAVVKTWITDYEFQTVECFLSDLEAV